MTTEPTNRGGADPLCGQVIDGRWQIERQVGTGGMSRVYLGWAIKTGVPLAIKIIEYAADPALRARSINEARAMMTLKSNYVVHALDVGELASGQLYIVMEYLDGQTLEAELQRCGPLPWERVARLGLQICFGLATAHRHNIIHRDIKPQNCVLTTVDDDPDHVTLIDFGIARDLASEASLTQQGFLIGTPEYLAPEIIRGVAKASVLSDIYALGATLYKLLTGKTPFQGPNKLAIFEAHLETTIPPPSQAAPAMRIPAAVDAIIVRALDQSPNARFPTVEAFAQALREVLQTPAAGRTESMTPATPPPVRAESKPAAVPPASTKPAPPGLLPLRSATTPPLRKQVRPVVWSVQRLRLLTIVSMAVCFVVVTQLVRPSAYAPKPEQPVPSPTNPVASPPAVSPRPETTKQRVEPVPRPVIEPASQPPNEAAPQPPNEPTPQPAVEPPAPEPIPEPTFPYADAKRYVDEQQGYLRSTCLARAKKATTSVKIQLHVRANGRPTAQVIHSDPAVRECIRELFKIFMFNPSPRGGSFEYSLTAGGSTIRKLPPDPRYVK